MKLQKIVHTHIVFILLFLLTITVFVSHTLYVTATFQHAKWDEHLFLDEGVATYHFFIKPNAATFSSMLTSYLPRPPLYGTLIALGILVGGITNTYKIALLINGFFYCGTIAATYFFAKEFLSKKSSLLASLIFAFYGFPLFYLHFAYSETTTTFFVVLTLLFLKKSHNFYSLRSVMLMSLFFTLGNLTRWMIPVFVGLPMAVSFFLGIKDQLFAKKRHLQNYVLSLLVFLLIGVGATFLLYYLPNLSSFLHYYKINQKFDVQWVSELTYLPPGLSNVFSIHSVMFYFNILSQQTIFFFLLFGCGFLLSIRFIKKYYLLVLAFIGAYIILTFGAVLKDDRYIVPIYPTMAIISAITFDHIKNNVGRKLLILLTVIIGLLNFLGSSWGIGPMGKQGLKDLVLPSFFPHPRRIYLTSINWPPRKDEIHEREIARIVLHDYKKKSHPPLILNTYTFNPLELDVAFSSLQKYELNNTFTETNLRVITRGDYKDLFLRLNTADYMLVKANKKMVDSTKFTNYPTDQMIIVVNQALSLPNGKLPGAFVPLKSVTYPLDKVSLTIYKKNRPVSKDEWDTFGQLLIQVDPTYTQEITEAF